MYFRNENLIVPLSVFSNTMLVSVGLASSLALLFLTLALKKKKIEPSKVLSDWGCESYVWIVWQYLIRFFLVLFSSFEQHIIWLNRLSTTIVFDWIVPVAVHWLNSFSNCTEFDQTVYLVSYIFCWTVHLTVFVESATKPFGSWKYLVPFMTT